MNVTAVRRRGVGAPSQAITLDEGRENASAMAVVVSGRLSCRPWRPAMRTRPTSVIAHQAFGHEK